MPADESSRRRHRVNGDGSVYKRQDGYWAGAFYTHTNSGARKRIVVYGRTLTEARDKLGRAAKCAIGNPCTRSVVEAGSVSRVLARAGSEAQQAPGHIRAV